MAIYITGDTHGPIDTPNRFNTDRLQWMMYQYRIPNFDKDKDYMIIAGDLGLIFSTNFDDKTEKSWTEYVGNKPWTTLFIDGNHENFERLNALPEIEMFGGKVGKYTDSIYHLKRGNIYTIEEKTFFTMGGGVSIDKLQRRDRISWWEEEMPNYAEYKKAMDSLVKVNFKVDYVITHTAPDFIRISLLKEVGMLNIPIFDGTTIPYKDKDQLSLFLEKLVNEYNLNFKKWYFGHYHIDKTIYNYEALYERILRIE